MLVRKIKCPACGAFKINEFTTAYIYCDFCGSLMGYDIEMLQEESREVFTPENMSKSAQQKFIRLSQELSEALNQKNEEDFLKAQLQMHETEFELYNRRFSPKIKQPAYRKKFLDFYERFWKEKLANNYFEKNAQAQQKFMQYSEKVTSNYTDGAYKALFDDAFKDYLDAVKEYTEESVNETMNMQSMAYHPEGVGGASREVLYKQSLAALILVYDDETIKKSLEHLNLKTEFIETEAVDTQEVHCVVCDAFLNVPEGSEKIICETCGSPNKPKSGKITCLGCGADFQPSDTETCEYCGAQFVKVGKKKPTETNTKKTPPPQTEHSKKKKGFWGKFFG